MPIEYFAGIVDGEGCFGRYGGKNGQGRPYMSSRLVIVNTHLPLLEKIQERYGGYIRHSNKWQQARNPNLRDAYTITWQGAKCEALARLLSPHLIVKQEQVKRVLNYEKAPRRKCNCTRIGRKHAADCSIRSATLN